ncbi:MAG TPA: Glu/Leu/Phe/Val dehydrogenase dimerization domain-containing protein [Chlamydiales bacterium]|nr:Glu/Leu/Phe/Val dehydrogenase dimerization domain-containing protein [Chlamydiales bacterium]
MSITAIEKNTDLVIENLNIPDYEKVLKITNKKTGLKAIIAIHNTTLGSALGGIRIYPYASFDDALQDVLRLSKGMTYKAAVSEVGLGGGKSVIIADPTSEKTPELLQSFGEAVDSLQGEYICAEDMNCTTADVMEVRKTTKYVVGLPHEKSSGNPAPYTAWGTYRGIQSVAAQVYGSKSLEGKKIALQGLGSVGMLLLEHLFWEGAEIVATDVDQEKLAKVAHQYGIQTVQPDAIYDVECDIFVPCAMGAIINDRTIHRLKCKAIAGCANNQLHQPVHGDILKEKGILYAPDFVINAGGLLNVSIELEENGYCPVFSRRKVHNIYDVLMQIYKIAAEKNISTDVAAVEFATYRIEQKIGKRSSALTFHHSL